MKASWDSVYEFWFGSLENPAVQGQLWYNSTAEVDDEIRSESLFRYFAVISNDLPLQRKRNDFMVF